MTARVPQPRLQHIGFPGLLAAAGAPRCYWYPIVATYPRVDVSSGHRSRHPGPARADRRARLPGVPLNEALERLIEEHEVGAAITAYDRLRSDADRWADYQAELAEWDVTVGDGLPNAQAEYPGENR